MRTVENTRSITVDFGAPLRIAYAVLFVVGVIGFTPLSVLGLVLLSDSLLPVTYTGPAEDSLRKIIRDCHAEGITPRALFKIALGRRKAR